MVVVESTCSKVLSDGRICGKKGGENGNSWELHCGEEVEGKELFFSKFDLKWQLRFAV